MIRGLTASFFMLILPRHITYQS
ncbi:hypothetical protein DESC_240034 [Desulfosarcina cetonica]|nr:hypothetical protein DESC_240034 [Desulfosarcina cetonica]